MAERIYGMCRMNPGLAGEFKRTFNQPLKRFWLLESGFDLVAFDDFIGCDPEKSLEETLRSRYSGSAVVLIRRLISD